MFLVYRLHATEIEGLSHVWISHEDWCETPEEMREPLSRDDALKLIDWTRGPGDRYRIRNESPTTEVR